MLATQGAALAASLTADDASDRTETEKAAERASRNGDGG
jgi:hypothetical protein